MEAETVNAAEPAVDTAELAREQMEARLNATIRDPLLTHIRALKKPWEKLSEREQTNVIESVEETARSVIRQACAIIAQRGFDSIGIRLQDFACEEGRIKGKFEASMVSDYVQVLADHQSQSATIVLVDPAAFMRGEWAKADPDQPEIPLETAQEEGGEDADEEADDDQRRAPRRAKVAA